MIVPSDLLYLSLYCNLLAAGVAWLLRLPGARNEWLAVLKSHGDLVDLADGVGRVGPRPVAHLQPDEGTAVVLRLHAHRVEVVLVGCPEFLAFGVKGDVAPARTGDIGHFI